MLTEKQLTYFLAIAGAGSFRRAAEAIHIAQPALSRHMRLLEQELGVQLFFRRPTGISLTDAGELLLERGQYLNRLRDQAYADVAAKGTVPTGRVGLGAPPSVANILFRPLATNYLKQHRGVQLSLFEGVGHLQRWLASGEIDLAIIGKGTSSEFGDFKRKELLTEPILLVAAKGVLGDKTALPPEDLLKLPLIITPAPSTVRTLLDKLSVRTGVAPRVVVETQSVHAQADLVAAGLGYALLPHSAITDDQRANTLSTQRIDGWSLHRSLAWRSDIPLTAAVSMMIEQVISQMHSLARAGAFGTDAEFTL